MAAVMALAKAKKLMKKLVPAPLPAWRAPPPGLRELSGRRGHGRRRRAPAPHRCRVGGLALSAGLLRCEHCHLRDSPAFPARTASLTDAGLSSLFGLSLCRAEKPAHSAAAVFRSTRGF